MSTGAVESAAAAGVGAAARQPALSLELLGSFEARLDGISIALPMNAQRLLAFLAVHGRSMIRSFVAGSLWLDSTDDRAAGSLRSSLWRVNREAVLIEASGDQLRLVPGVAVDIDDAVRQAHRLLDPVGNECPMLRELLLLNDLLPDWYDDWVTVERERFRQLRVHALERLCERLLEAERFGEASEAALASIQAEPLRESGHRLLIRVHLAEGNQGDALAHYNRFRALLLGELGLEPTSKMQELVAHLMRR